MNKDASLPGHFTAHNIRLDDGTETYPEAGYTMDSNAIFLAAKRMLELVYRDGLEGKRIVDLGCLEGGFATEFARLGMNSLGIEVRLSNYDNCMYTKQNVDLRNLEFVNDDAWNVAKYGKFDAVFATGLFYHVDRPREFLQILSDVCNDVLFLETHFATDVPSAVHNLSDLVENEGLQGRWYTEHDAQSREELEELKWASWANKRSFWIKKEYLLQAIYDVGFDMVLEQYDRLGGVIAHEMTKGFYKIHDRSMFVGIRSRAL